MSLNALRIPAILGLVLLAAGMCSPAAAATQAVSLAERAQRFMPVAGTPQRVAVADPAVADVQVLPAEGGGAGGILLTGMHAGDTEVRVWNQGGALQALWRVHVISAAHAALARAGQAPDARIAQADDTAVIAGQSASLLSHRAAQVAAGDKAADLSTVDTSSMVQVDVQVVELSRSVMKDAGIDWRAGSSAGHDSLWGGSAPLLPAALSAGSGFAVTYSPQRFRATLRLLESNGMARILARPSLVAMSGQSAKFLAGGEIPVPVSGGLGTQNVEYKPFGIGLTVSPTVLSSNRIALKVAPEASELDYTNTVAIGSGDQTTLLPSIRTRRADTMVELGDGESFIISGLVSRQTIANVDKVPFLGDLPIIGAFFRNLHYSQEERELVILVTPHLIRPIAKGARLKLPGEDIDREDSPANAWGFYLTGGMGSEQMPGFSR
ncbi:type II and III secretion system protein family protein [Castellaniella sp.]|uniref:type II and III secretion system protein family protein n=1 Tax=Castellaniella sp. TaxID=1955812 RepID=UPI003C7348AF